MVKLRCGDNLKILKGMPDNSIDSCVADGPYGLTFMGKKWDYDVPSVDLWIEVLRVLKPGGYLLSFGGTRTYHRMAVNIEDAGFEIRDQLQWLYGSGFPKSHNISKGIDKKAGAEREVIYKGDEPGREGRKVKGKKPQPMDWGNDSDYEPGEYTITAPATEYAKQWDGFGTALKPSNEPIVLARKPLSEKTIVANVLKWGCGGLNIDGCRIGYQSAQDFQSAKGGDSGSANRSMKGWGLRQSIPQSEKINTQGRWPANTLFDYAAAEMLDEQSGVSKSQGGKIAKTTNTGVWNNAGDYQTIGVKCHHFGDTGGASRFFYVAKASKRERGTDNNHPTVKPIKLMSYLCRLITPPKGIVLDPFMGSGTTGIAALQEGFNFIGIEIDKEYFKIASKRIRPKSRLQTP